MPIYEYQCKSCENVFEVIVMSNSPKEIRCTKCGSSEIDKLISPLSLKVSGEDTTSSSSCQSRGGFS